MYKIPSIFITHIKKRNYFLFLIYMTFSRVYKSQGGNALKLTNIISLYKEMKNLGLLRQQFDFEYNGVMADVFFFIDQQPFILAFGIKLTQSYFELEIHPGFEVHTPFSRKLYNLIIHEFNIHFSPSHKYSPFDFLNAFNNKIPQHLKDTQTIEPYHIANYRRDIEEADKIYFCGFINHSKNHASPENLKKTRLLMGEEAYKRCLDENISTKWTDEIGKDRYKEWKNINAEY